MIKLIRDNRNRKHYMLCFQYKKRDAWSIYSSSNEYYILPARDFKLKNIINKLSEKSNLFYYNGLEF